MSSLRQIEANRRNARKSTGPRSPEGKAASRFNALKTGLDAESQVIPSEDPAAFQALIDEYYQRFQPAAPEVRFLVDTLIDCEWQLRRFRKIESQVWEYQLAGMRSDTPLAQSFSNARDTFTRLQRRIDSARRSYHRALREIQRLPSARPAPQNAVPAPAPAPDPTPAPSHEIGFVPPISASQVVPTGPRPPADSTPIPSGVLAGRQDQPHPIQLVGREEIHPKQPLLDLPPVRLVEDHHETHHENDR